MTDVNNGPATDRHNQPVIDPTRLTTDAVNAAKREIEEKAVLREHSFRDLYNEKLDAVEDKFKLIEAMRVEQKIDTKQALDAALAAAKEAVKEQTTASNESIAKSEQGVAATLQQLGQTTSTEFASLRRELSDMKERVQGHESSRSGGEAALGRFYAAGAVLLAAIAIIMNLVTSH